MRVLVQRVNEANVKVDNKEVGSIKKGYLLFVGFTNNDNIDIIKKMVQKIIKLRIMDDDFNVMNKNILDTNGEILSVSQFTLYANCEKGNRPSYTDALNKDNAKILYNDFNNELKKYIKVETGIFGADMMVSLINNGPVTILLEDI